MKYISRLQFLVFLTLASCSSEDYNISNFVAGDAFTNSNLRVLLLDTLSVETSTMKIDSIITSGASRMLVGKYNDSIFGTIKASSYMGILPSTYTIDAEATYDSIALYLKYDDYYYHDTLQTNTIHVKQILKTLKPQQGDYFYNRSEVNYSDQDLGTLTYLPLPIGSDSLEIRLSDEWGLDIFSNLQEKTISTSDQFKDYFKGIALLPDTNDNGAIIGFSKTSNARFIRLYFSIAEESSSKQEYIDIYLDLSSSPVPFFNQILAEDPIAPLQTLVNKEVNLSSSESGNFSFIQSGIGIATRIQFPHLKNIYDIQGEGTILDAKLKIKPAQGTYDNKHILRDTLSVYIVDRNNDLTEQLLYAETTPVRGILNRDNEEFNDIYYEITLGSYIEKLLMSEMITNEALILLPNNYDSTVDRFVLNGMDHSDYSVVLEVTYAIYDENE